MLPYNKITSFKQKFLIIIFINLILLLPFLFFDLRILDKIFNYKNKLAENEKKQQELVFIKEKILKIPLYFDNSDSLKFLIDYIKQRKNLLIHDSSNTSNNVDLEIFISNLETIKRAKNFDEKYYNLLSSYEKEINFKLNLINNKISFYLESISRIVKILNWLIFFEILILLLFSLFLIYYVPGRFLASLGHIIKEINYNTLSIGKLELKQGVHFSELTDLIKKVNNIFLRVSSILLEYKQKINHQQKKVDFFIDFVDKPIISLDENFKILKLNQLSVKYLFFKIDDIGKNLKNINKDFFNEIYNIVYDNNFSINIKSDVLSNYLKRDILITLKNFEVKGYYKEFLIIVEL